MEEFCSNTWQINNTLRNLSGPQNNLIELKILTADTAQFYWDITSSQKINPHFLLVRQDIIGTFHLDEFVFLEWEDEINDMLILSFGVLHFRLLDSTQPDLGILLLSFDSPSTASGKS